MKCLVIIPDNCTGCKTCTLACSMIKGDSLDINKMGRSRISIHNLQDGRNIQVTCLQCVDAACIKVCESGALFRNPDTGAVDFDKDSCIACGLCEIACPFGHLYFDAQESNVEKCDLCQGNPICARFCPHGALKYE
jgi:anaerobic carbon-monoxide dehydrogenase iron sulfur subunit